MNEENSFWILIKIGGKESICILLSSAHIWGEPPYRRLIKQYLATFFVVLQETEI